MRVQTGTASVQVLNKQWELGLWILGCSRGLTLVVLIWQVCDKGGPKWAGLLRSEGVGHVRDSCTDSLWSLVLDHCVWKMGRGITFAWLRA